MKEYICKSCDKPFNSKDGLNMHKKAKHGDQFKEPMFSSSQLKKIKTYVIWFVILLAISGFFYWRSIPPTNSPIISFESTTYNFGTVSQAEGITSTQLQFTNTGDQPLVIPKMETSCMCTTASIIFDGVTGPGFGMESHGTNPTNWKQILQPGETATLKIDYDPNAHKNLVGPVTRTVSVYSNDKRNSKELITIKLNQVR